MRRRSFLCTVAAMAVTASAIGCGSSHDLAFRPQVGDKRVGSIEYGVVQSFSLMGQDMTMDLKLDLLVNMEVTAVSDAGDSTIQATFTHLAVKADGMGTSMAPDLSGVAGKQVVLTVNSAGKVTAVDGIDAVVQELSAGPGGGDPMKMVGQAMTSGLFEDETLRKLLGEFFLAAPPAPINVGQAWPDRVIEEGPDVPFSMTADVTLKSYADNKLTLTYSGPITANPDAMKEQMGGVDLGISLNLSGTGTGTVQKEPDAGWLVNKTESVDASGKINIDMDMPAGMPMPEQMKDGFPVSFKVSNQVLVFPPTE